MARRTARTVAFGLDAITIEGGLIAPEQVLKIAATDRNAKTAAAYGCPKGTNLADEITRYFRIGQALWSDYAKIEEPKLSHTAAFVQNLLAQTFGFDDLKGPVEHRDGSRRYRIALEGKGGNVPIVIAAPVADGDGFTKAMPEFGDGEGGRAKRNPVVLLQDWLNANQGFYWGLVFAGDRLRLMRDNASLTRAAWIEADLGAIFRDEMFADFTALWLLIHATRFGHEDAAPSSAPLEQWREAGMKTGTAARERLREGVEAALLEMGRGLVEANPDLRNRIETNAVSMPSLFEELLRTVYRLIFLAVAEDRGLLHPRRTAREVKDLYESSYSFGFWRERSRRRVARDGHHDAWEGMKVTLRSLENGQDVLGLPALGGMFARGNTPIMDTAYLPNRRFLEAIFRLGYLREDSSLHRINWRDMKTEELGSVYESLLEIRPRLAANGEFELDSGAKGNARKTSGSYYTPDSLVETLLDSALDPVLEKAEADGEDTEAKIRAILDLKIIDPACGSGHFLLGAARRMADKVAELRNPDAPDRQAALRDVVARCIHGVDLNPMAVELAKVALWIESVSPGQPLGFLDANIRCGNALLGVFDLDALEQGIPDDAYKPLTGDSKDAAKYWKAKNKDEKKGQGSLDFDSGTGAMPPRKLAANLSTIRRMGEDTVGQVEKKREAFENWRRDPNRWATKVACDLYTAAFLLPKLDLPDNYQHGTVPTTADVWKKLGGRQLYGPLEAAGVDAAEFADAFHWPLAFPDVLIGKGGFDVVLGNPPWELVQLNEVEYFDSRDPEIAELKGAERKRAVALLSVTRPEVFADYVRDKRAFEASNEFSRESGRYPLTAANRINTYQLFAELGHKLRDSSGMMGMILPTGIATSDSSKIFFAEALQSQSLVSVFAFYEVRYWFEATDDKNSFCLFTLGGHTEEPEFVFDAKPISDLDDERRRYRLSADDIMRLNPDSLTAPIFRARGDADISRKLYATLRDTVRPLEWIELRQNVFSSSLKDDLEQFSKPRDQHAEPVPVYRGASIHQFDPCYASFNGSDYDRVPKDESLLWCEPQTDKYVDASYLKERFAKKGINHGFNVAIRRIARASDDRTMIAAAIPAVAADDTLSILIHQQSPKITVALLGNLNSLVLDFACGHKIAGPDIRKHNFSQLPILPPTAYSEDDLGFIVPRVLELSYTSHSIAPFARDLGYDGAPFAWDEDRRAQLRAELDAWYALAYGLSRDELRYILDPKEIMGENYPSETFRVLQKNEIKKYGEYRTQRLVLAAYDALIAKGMRPRTEGYR